MQNMHMHKIVLNLLIKISFSLKKIIVVTSRFYFDHAVQLINWKTRLLFQFFLIEINTPARPVVHHGRLIDDFVIRLKPLE